MYTRLRAWLLGEVAIASIALLVAPAYGDPIVITGGHIAIATPSEGIDPPFGFSLTAPGLSFGASIFNVASASGRPGDLMNLSATFAVQNPPFQTSAVVVGGVPYSAIYPGGALTFTAVPVALGPASDLAPFHVATPFTFTGHVEGFSDAGRTTAPLFHADVAGSGVAEATGIVHGNGSDAVYMGRVVSYTFSPISSTPEPSSLMLSGVGAALLLWRGRRWITA